MSEFILYMQDYLREAQEIVCRKASPACDEDALHIVRKVEAMAASCMEQNGIQKRDMDDLKRACELHGVTTTTKKLRHGTLSLLSLQLSVD